MKVTVKALMTDCDMRKKQEVLTFPSSTFPRNGMLVKSQLEEHGCGGHLTTMGTLNKRSVPFMDPRSAGGKGEETEVEKYNY